MKKSILMMAAVVVLACVCDVQAWSDGFETYLDGLLTSAPWDEGSPGGGQVVTDGAGYTGKGLVGSGLGNIWRAADTDPSANVLSARLYSAPQNFSRYYFGFHTEAITDGYNFPGSDAVVIYMMWHTDGGFLSFESYDFDAGVFQGIDTEWTGQSIGLLSNTWYDVRMTLNGDDTVSGEYKLTTSDTWIPIGDGLVDVVDTVNFAPNFVGVAGQELGRIDDLVNGPPTVVPIQVDSAITEDTTLYSHVSLPILDMNMGAYQASDTHTHFVLGYDARSASSLDQARPILKADDILADLSNVGVTAIDSATLHLFRVADETASKTVTAYRVTTGGWVEGTKAWEPEDGSTSWNSVRHNELLWNTPGGDYDPTPLGTLTTTIGDPAHTEYTVEITDAAKHWMNYPAENYGVLLITTFTSDDSTRWFAASEDTIDDSAYVPFVRVIGAAPLPSSVVLLICGLVGVLLPWARRKRK